MEIVGVCFIGVCTLTVLTMLGILIYMTVSDVIDRKRRGY
jgi:hypothetical protein